MQAVYTSVFLAILFTSGAIGLKSPKSKDRNSKTKVSGQIDIDSDWKTIMIESEFRPSVSKLSTRIDNYWDRLGLYYTIILTLYYVVRRWTGVAVTKYAR